VKVEGSQMTVYPGSLKCKALGNEFDADDALIEQLHRVHNELSEMLALATQTPAGDSHDVALACLRTEANALARKFLELSESLLASTGDACDRNN
jgi:hypothetical protein